MRIDGGILHLGASFRYRQADENASFFRYRQRAHNHLSPRFLDTGELARQDRLWGLETAYILGPMTIQGEWSWLRAKPAAADNPLRFSGGYVGLNWIVTGEHRAYRAGRGSFGRIRVARPITASGPGAFEVTVRADHLDLSDGILRAGEQNTYVAGINWYPVDHVRFMVNLARAEVRDAYVSGLNDANGSNRVNSLGMRAQIDW